VRQKRIAAENSGADPELGDRLFHDGLSRLLLGSTRSFQMASQDLG
jgi:hypothetical protein